MLNVSVKICGENQNTHFMFSFFFFQKSCRLCDNVEKYDTARQATDGNTQLMRFTCWDPTATNTHSGKVISIFQCNNGCTKAPQRYVIRALPVLFCPASLAHGNAHSIS
jgi:hypothetical protein